jgi:hypothetical protein
MKGASGCRNVVALLLAFSIAACSVFETKDPAAVRLNEGGILFLTQNLAPNAVMEALFQGRIVADEAGCLRLQPGDRVTVIWPKGFTLERVSGAFLVRDAGGRAVGRIGDTFRLGGGEVPYLHQGIGLSAADRERAMSRCPGIFWIVGSV